MTSEKKNTKRWRVLFVNRMASMERGGGETFDLEVARHLAQMGHQITFLTGIPLFGRARLPIDTLKSKIDMLHIRAPMFPWYPWDRVKAGWRLRVAEFWLFERLAARWAWKHRAEFDIIQVCELPTFVSSFKSKTENRKSNLPKVVMRLTAPNVFDRSGGVQRADALIASGTSITKIRKSVRPDCHDIPNAVDTEHFRPQESDFRSRHNIRPDELVLLYVARFQDFKNHALLIEAFARVMMKESRARLVLAGSGPLLKQAKERVQGAGLGNKVDFLGEVPFEELPGVYAAADLKIISSYYESFCFAAVEAMSSGLPVITTDCGWVPGLVGDRRPPVEKQWVEAGGDPPGRFDSDEPGHRLRQVPGGVVVDRADPDSMAEAILQLLNDESRRRACGVWNRDKAVREHGWAASAQRLEKVYEDSLASGALGTGN